MSSVTNSLGRTGRFSLLLGSHLLGMLGLLGRLLVKSAGLIVTRGRIPRGVFFRQVDRLGFGSLWVIILASSTVGISLVFLSLDQLKSLGGLPLLAFFFSKGLFREIGPIIAGIVMAVRIGPQVTVEIGSVPMHERVIKGPAGEGLDIGKLLLPAFLAILLVGPALYLLGSFFGLLAGVISQTRGSFENFIVFYRMILDTFSMGDMVFGLYKSLMFGITVVVVAGHIGFITHPDPEKIQQATVTSIVVSAVMVLAVNSLFALSYTHTSLKYQLQGL